jgi:hypothetical protein
MDWSKKLLVFVCLPMFAVAGVSYFFGGGPEESAGYSDEAAKAMEDPDYYEPDYYDDDPKNAVEWEDAGSAAYGDGDGDGDGDIDEDYHVPAFAPPDDDYLVDEDMMWPGATEMYVEEEPEPPPAKDWPWMTIATAGIGSLTGLISALSALLRAVTNFRRKEDDDDEEEEAPPHE